MQSSQPRTRTRPFAIALVGILGVPATAAAVEPFHLQPIRPRSGLLFETRPTIFEAAGDPHFGIGWLIEGRLAFLQDRVHVGLAVPFAMGFVEGSDPVSLGNLELGGGYGDRFGEGWSWGVGGRFSFPTAGDAGAPNYAGYAGRPYNWERHVQEAATMRAFGDIGIDDGTFVGQLEMGFDFYIPDGPSNELGARLGFLVGVHLAPRTILMMELVWVDLITADSDGQFSIQPGIRFPASTLDLALYLTMPIDDQLGGNAAALGFQLLWNP